jgi:hypothetical protein
VGVAPDVTIDPKQALDVGQSLALATLAKRGDADPANRADWDWARIAVEARLHPVVIPAARLRSLAGRYGERQIIWRDGALSYERAAGKVARLIPLTADGLFTVEGYDDHLRIRLADDALEQQWIDEPNPTRLSKN